MSDNHSNYFSTGEFAKLCKVNKQTLFYYDKIGLLSPVRKDDKGYRYYSINQYEYFSVIELLKEIGMPLKEIRLFMQHKSPGNFLSLMQEKKKEIASKKRAIELMERIVDAKISLMEKALETDFSSINLERLPARTLYLSRNIENVSEEEFVEAVSDFIDELYRLHLDTGKPIGGMTVKASVLSGDYTNYSHLYMEQPDPPSGRSFFRVQPSLYLVGYHTGTEATIGRTYERMFAEMNRLGKVLGEFVFEEYVWDAVVADEEEEYVTKILFQLEE